MQHSLNELYSQYLTGIIERSDLEGLIYQYFANNQENLNFKHWSQDEYDDYVSWLYPRIKGAVDSYREAGASFEVYMMTVMRLASKEYRMRITTKSITEYAAWSVNVRDLYAHEEAPAYLQDTSDKTQTVISRIESFSGRRRNNPRQLLILILKCYYYVSDDFLDRIAPIVGIDKEKLREMLDRIRTIRTQRDNEIYLMRERIYSQFYRCIVYEKKLSYYQQNSTAAVKMKNRLEKARQRLEKMRKRMAGIRTDATNRQVAEVIGISKGAVDSSLYTLKTKWNILADKSLLN